MKKLKCKICGFGGNNLITHLKFKHRLTVEEYRKRYGHNSKVIVISDSAKKRVSDSLKKFYENPDERLKQSINQKNGGSRYTVKYWAKRGYSDEESKRRISELQQKNSHKNIEKNNMREQSHFCKEFWIKRGKCENDAIASVSNIQSKLSNRSSKFLGHVRTDDQKQRISHSMKNMILAVGNGKWASHFGKFTGRSKVEADFFNYIRENISPLVEANVPIGYYIVDVIEDTKIIEFYGDFWHANPLKYDGDEILNGYSSNCRLVSDIWKRDEVRINYLRGLGYDVLIIWESEWNTNKDECVSLVKEYLL